MVPLERRRCIDIKSISAPLVQVMAIAEQVEAVVPSTECRVRLQHLCEVVLAAVVQINIEGILEAVGHLEVARRVLEAK